MHLSPIVLRFTVLALPLLLASNVTRADMMTWTVNAELFNSPANRGVFDIPGPIPEVRTKSSDHVLCEQAHDVQRA